MNRQRLYGTVVLGTVSVLLASGCTSNVDATSGAIQVSSSENECTLSGDSGQSGHLTFSVANDGNEVTEFYLLAEDGLRIIGEVENIGPGLSRDLVVTAPAGEYLTACKPGMVGDGIQAPFTVEESGKALAVDEDRQQLLDTGTEQYAAYVKDQTEQLLTKTRGFAEAFAAGDEKVARGMYAPTRMHWERIEPVAESFGDLDPKLDLREADLEPGTAWTGWHRAEKDLFPPKQGYTAMTAAERQKIANQMVTDTEDLYNRTRDITFTADKLGNGAKELLDEVATGKVTGEEEIWSHTDLWDFQANVDGARIAFEDLRPALEDGDPELAKELHSRFNELQDELDKHRKGDGFALYTDLSNAEIRALSGKVDALGEPLSRLTAAVVL